MMDPMFTKYSVLTITNSHHSYGITMSTMVGKKPNTIKAEAIKFVSLYKCSKKNFTEFISDDKADKFAHTFVSKANLGKYWDRCVGYYEEKELCGAIITTISKKEPRIANLQLLHTFAKHRRKGVAKKLCEYSLLYAIKNKAKYFRVSAEPEAVVFYESIGLTMLGEQKSKSQLSMFLIAGNTFSDGVYDTQDPIINNAVFKRGRGGCVRVFSQPDYNGL